MPTLELSDEELEVVIRAMSDLELEMRRAAVFSKLRAPLEYDRHALAYRKAQDLLSKLVGEASK